MDITSGKENKSESEVQAEIHRTFNCGPTRLFKNVSGNFWQGKFLGIVEGIAKLANPRRIQAGVGGVGGSDRIGPHQIKITQAMVGKTVAVFTAIELKKTSGGIVSDEQQKFINFILDFGGIAGVARTVEEINFLFDSYLAKLQS